MKVLIAHAKCGSGHTMAAQAIYDSLKDEKGQDIQIYDLLAESPFHRRWFGNGYKFLVKHWPFVWKWMYQTSDHRLCRRMNTGEHRFIFPLFAFRLIKQQYDLVVSTHFFVSEIAAKLKRKGLIKSKIVTVVTDFNVHKTWVHQGTDLYLVASEYTADVLRTLYKIDPKMILVWGIPLRENFYNLPSHESLREKYAIPKDLFTVLIFSSDYGAGPILEIVERLRNKCGLLVICGKDRRLKKRLSKIVDAKHLYVREYVSDIWELMAASDAVVLKAGGLSVAECMHLKKTMLFMQAFYGQETENVQYAASQGVGFYPPKIDDLVAAIKNLSKDDELLTTIAKRYAKMPVQNSTKKLKELILNNLELK